MAKHKIRIVIEAECDDFVPPAVMDKLADAASVQLEDLDDRRCMFDELEKPINYVLTSVTWSRPT
jgi:hypothetical protein